LQVTGNESLVRVKGVEGDTPLDGAFFDEQVPYAKDDMTEIIWRLDALRAFEGFSRVATLFGDRGIGDRN